jgi:hypothetical protein
LRYASRDVMDLTDEGDWVGGVEIHDLPFEY